MSGQKTNNNSNGNNNKITPVEEMELQERCARRPKSASLLSSIPCCGRLREKFCFKVFVFLLVFGLDAADLISDWLLYRDVSATEEGLVYGPPEDILRYFLLGFSIVGSITFVFEIANLWWEIFRNNPWIDVDLLSAITVWIEDVPQIIINVVIVACREEAISYFQLVKASVIIIGVVIRIIVSLIRYCSKKARHDLECAKVNPSSRRHVVYRVFIMLGLIITLGGAITIFLFTQSERNPDGSLNFKIPHSVIEGEYDNEKYFKDVSIYFSHELFDWGQTTKTSTENTNLLRLFQINDIRHGNVDKTIKIEYDNLTGNSKIVISVDDLPNALKAVECFQMDRANKKITTGSNCANYLTGVTSQIIFKFHYVKAEVPRLLFGDIKYNVRTGSASSCTVPNFIINADVSGHVGNQKVAALHYYRNPASVNHVNTTTVDWTFYQSLGMQDIRDVWQTGFAYCKSSGSMAPHRDDSVDVKCQ